MVKTINLENLEIGENYYYSGENYYYPEEREHEGLEKKC